MATLEECEAALEKLAHRLSGVDADLRRRHVLERTVSCKIPDLGATFSGQLRDGGLHDVEPEPLPGAQIKLTVTSDDLVAITEGRLNFATAWATGKLKVEASMLDLLKLRGML
ncbi:MAG: SCP2 sterol-binding domain-containing protein [Actinomycetota bacterium]|nr:SCP2 sterol-binding domain-containing protein [Actinomycetota bacterium]